MFLLILVGMVTCTPCCGGTMTGSVLELCAKANCPVSRVLNATITMDAKLIA